MTTRAVAQPPTEAELADAAAERVHALLDAGRVREARVQVADAAERFPRHDRLRKLALALEPPRLLTPTTGTRMDLRGQIAWLKAHAIEYPGQWLALRGETLLAASADLGLLEQTMEQNGGRDGVMLFYVPDREW